MPGDIQLRMPGDMTLPAQFFGQFSFRDLVRIAVPALVGFGYAHPPQSVTDIAVIAAGLVVGVAIYAVRPHGRPLDTHILIVVQWFLGARHVHDGSVRTRNNAYLQTEDGAVIAVVQVAPTNLAMQTETGQAALHGVYNQLLEAITYPIEVHTQQREIDLSTYITELDNTETGRETEATLREAYTAYCRYLNRGELVRTDHYITVRVAPTTTDRLTGILASTPVQRLTARLNNVLPVAVPQPGTDEDDPEVTETQVVELNRRCNEVVQAASRGEMAADRVTGPRLVDLSQRFHTGRPNLGTNWVQQPDDEGRGEYRDLTYITECPSTANLAWPVELLQVDGLVDLTQVIYPQHSADTTTTLSRITERLNAEITSQQDSGYGGTNRYEARLRDAEWMLDLLADRDDAAFQYGCYVTAHNSDRERCEETCDHVTTRLDTMQFEYDTSYFRTDDAYQSQSPLHGDPLDETMLMPGRSAAAGFPFATTDAIGTQGVVYGEDHAEKTPILLNRFGWDAGHLVRMGRTGSGKSYAAKLELMRARLAYPDLRVVVVDPKQEYSQLLRTFGGTVHTLGEDEYSFENDLTGFEVPDRGNNDNAAVLTAAVEAIHEATARDQRPTLVFIDEAHKLMNHEQGRATLSTLVREARDTIRL